MPQKAQPEERTILQALSELAGYEDVRVSEDLGKLSDIEFTKKWVLPMITGAEAETEEHQPGAIDLTFAAIPFVGGSIRTGFKLAKEGVKKLGKAYKSSVRPRVFPEKDELLRMGEDVGVMEDELQALREATEGYQPGTYAQQVAEEAIPTQPVAKAVGASAESDIRHIIRETQGTIRGGVGGGDLTYNQATSIYEDIGREGFDEFKEELLSMPQDARELAVDNFMAKYKLSAGTVLPEEAAAVYKRTRFTSNMPDQVITTSRGSTKLEVKTYRTGENTSSIRIEMEPLDYRERVSKSWQLGAKGLDPKKPGRAYANFSIEKITNAAGESFDRVYNVHFYGTGNEYTRTVFKTLPDGTVLEEIETIFPGQRYAGLIMRELLTKVPPNTLIDERILTYDSLYSLIKNTIKAQSKLIFNNPNLKRTWTQSSGPSEMSPITLLWNEMIETGSATDEATDRVIAELDKMIKEYSKKAPGMVEGIPEFKRQASREGYIEYNPISVQKLGVLIAGALGFKNKEAFIDFVSHDPESVEAQVFDNEFSL